jgi:CheY-like chemotaxis protein
MNRCHPREITRDIPVVLLTGHGEPALRERSEREGRAAFFVKALSS